MNTPDGFHVVGLDGCSLGWLACFWKGPGTPAEGFLLRALGAAEDELPGDTAVVAIDIPLGLADVAERGGRACDRLARKVLGQRRSSVFSPPARCALEAVSHSEASRFNRQSGPEAPGISIQTYSIFPKLVEAQAAVEHSHWLRERIIEVHPEVSFLAIAGSPLDNPKKSRAGKDERRDLLEQQGFVNLGRYEDISRRCGAKTDDALDACVAAWTAFRRAQKAAAVYPSYATSDDHVMRIWY